MASSKLYIPKRIKVGFQKRADTYNGTLAYVTYLDDRGVHRKAASWESWRHKDIEPVEHDNVPTTGFVLHKDVKRYNWSHFSSKRTLIRVYDPRGLEIEITTENLIGVLMSCDCSHRALCGEFVYAWSGPELVLLPCNAEEYAAATEHTALQAGKVRAADLKPGCAYRTKQGDDILYLGRFPWYEWRGENRRSYSSQPQTREPQRMHVFTPVNWTQPVPNPNGYTPRSDRWLIKSGLDQLAARVTEEPLPSLASTIDAFKQETRTAAVVGWEVVPVEVSFETRAAAYPHTDASLVRSTYYTLVGNRLTRWSLSRVAKQSYDATKLVDQRYTHELLGYQLTETEKVDTASQTTIPIPYRSSYDWSYGYRNTPPPSLTEAQIRTQGLGDLYVLLEDGRRLKVGEETRSHYGYGSDCITSI